MTVYRRNKELGKVLESFNLNGDFVCVDFFRRTDNSFGYEEYRRDPETGEGWFPIGFYGDKVFATLSEAKCEALKTIVWLDAELK